MKVYKNPNDMLNARAKMREDVRNQLADFFTNPKHEFNKMGFSLSDFNEAMYDTYGDEFDNDPEIENIYNEYFSQAGYDPKKLNRFVTPDVLGIGDKWAKHMKPGFYDKHPGAKYK